MVEVRTVRAAGGSTGTRGTAPFGRPVLALCNLDFTYVFSKRLDPDSVERSLAQVLAVYPCLAGRIVPNCRFAEINLNNEGVPLQIVRAEGKVEDFPKDLKKRGVYGVIPDLKAQVAGKAPLFYARITHLDNGSVLGVTINHLVLDAWGFAQFMQDWSACHAGQSVAEAPDHQPPAVFEEVQSDAELEALLDTLQFKPWGYPFVMKVLFWHLMPLAVSKMSKADLPDRLRINLPADRVNQLKAKAEAAAGTWVSTHEAILTHTWLALADACDLPEAGRKALYVNLVINLRGKLSGCPMRAIGNHVATSPAAVDISGGFAAVAGRVHAAVRAACSEDNVRRNLKLTNRTARTYQMYQHKAISMGSAVPGLILHWNYQAGNDYCNVDLGAGKPVAGVPWNWDEEVKITKAPDGGVDIFLATGDKGVARWITPGEVAGVSLPAISRSIVLATVGAVIGMKASRCGGWGLWAGAAAALVAAGVVGKEGQRRRAQKVAGFLGRFEELLEQDR